MGCSVSKQEEGMLKFEYCWLHIETGNTGNRDIYCVNYLDFLYKLNEFNKQGGSKWKYWIK
jgi:hypothetical protein